MTIQNADNLDLDSGVDDHLCNAAAHSGQIGTKIKA